MYYKYTIDTIDRYYTYPPTTEWMKNLKSPWSEEIIFLKFMNTESTLLTST